MKTTVEIEWDGPEDQAWLCAENIALALHVYCPNTKFKVVDVSRRFDGGVVQTVIRNARAESYATGRAEAIEECAQRCATVRLDGPAAECARRIRILATRVELAPRDG
jgi:hypothetical protein